MSLLRATLPAALALAALAGDAHAGAEERRAERMAQAAAAWAASPVVEWQPAAVCTHAVAPRKTLKLEFTRDQPRHRLPNGVEARALCARLPAAGNLVAMTETTSGGTYKSATTVQPSLLYLDALFQPMLSPDYRAEPAWQWKERWSGVGLQAEIFLGKGEDRPAYVVMYLDPAHFDATHGVTSSATTAAVVGTVAFPITASRKFDVPVTSEGKAMLRVE